MHLPQEETTIARLLQQAGYGTWHVGKWHCNGQFNSPQQPQPGDHGFDHWFSTQNNAIASHRNPHNFVRNGQAVGDLEGYSCQLVTDEAIRCLEQRSPQSPFFLMVCYHEPHEPVASPPELVAEYADSTSNSDQAHYFANVTNVDRAVGRLLETLDRLQLADNTLVIFTSDNGPETLNRYPRATRSYGSPGELRGMKLHLYEGGIRVPGILRFPGRIQPGQECAEPIGGVDILPTLCELAGIPLPPDRVLDGCSIAALFRGERLERPQPLYWDYDRAIGGPKAALRDGDLMVLGKRDASADNADSGLLEKDGQRVPSAELVEFELYDLAQDAAQQHDLSAERPEELRRLRGELVERYRQVQQEGPRWETPREGKQREEDAAALSESPDPR
jgi:arylsulfatase A